MKYEIILMQLEQMGIKTKLMFSSIWYHEIHMICIINLIKTVSGKIEKKNK